MIHLTECLGTSVLDSDGARVGRLTDLAVRLEDPYPLVSRLQVKTSRRRLCYLAWEVVASFGTSGPQLTVPRQQLVNSGAFSERLPSDELLLAEHVLDTQILDVTGRRVVRVGEVELELEAGNLVFAGVEVGRAALLRRLGLRRLSRRVEHELVDWRNLHIASGRGHALQLRSATARVHRLDPSQVGHLVRRLPLTRAADVLRSVRSETAAGALTETHPELGGRLARELDPGKAASILSQMPVGDAAAALWHMPVEQREKALVAMPVERSRELRELLARPPQPVAEPTPVRRRFRKVLSARRHAPS